MMAGVEDENSETMGPTSPPAPNPRSGPGQVNPVTPKPSDTNGASHKSSPKETPNPRAFMASAASKIAAQPLPNYDPHVWGVLTAISNNARKRVQVNPPISLPISTSEFVQFICTEVFSMVLHAFACLFDY